MALSANQDLLLWVECGRLSTTMPHLKNKKLTKDGLYHYASHNRLQNRTLAAVSAPWSF